MPAHSKVSALVMTERESARARERETERESARARERERDAYIHDILKK